MNAERLHAIALALSHEMTSRDMVSRMQKMTATLRAVVQQSNAGTQQAFATARGAMFDALTDAPSDGFSPAWRQILNEIGGEDLFGKGLKERIETGLANNQITPAIALQEFEQLLVKLQAFDAALDEVKEAFEYFEIGSEELEPGECEIGILIPRLFVKNQLPELVEELKREEFILNTFSEVGTGKIDRLQIKTLSSSGLMIFLQANPTFAAALAIAIERIVALYKQLLEIRKLRVDLEKQELPEDVLKGVETHADKLMKAGIEKAAVEIVAECYTGKDEGRKHELVSSVRISMNMLANRIDHGVNFEVRVAPPAADESGASDEKVRKAVAAIQAATPNMQFLRLEGPPLLRLPEKLEKEQRHERSEKEEKPKK